MKYLKRITLLFLIIAVALSLTACGDKEIISKTPTAVRLTPEHQETVTDYKYKYNFLLRVWVLVPDVHTETIPDKYEVQYIITYADETTATRWETVDKAEYDAAAALLCGGGQ